ADQVVRIFGGRGKGVETRLEEDTVRFSLKVSLQYGQPIPAIAEQIQETVARRVEEMTGLRVGSVDVYVQEIQFPQAEGTT
ncbi:TPA: Asp23/Gls24 family envelope stress response protein, partial [Candidatus Bipolaricaulota bacterium]|nr:Asp23/Gls24 family envelope stress response protein [Candidatus Bipolaricaulota bacterium]